MMAHMLQLKQFPAPVRKFDGGRLLLTYTNHKPMPLTLSYPLSPCLSNSNGVSLYPPTKRNSAFLISRWKPKSQDMTSQLELGKPDRKQNQEKRVNGIFWILLINLGIFVADHVFQVPWMRGLYLYHNQPAWYQFITSTFCHSDWNHLSSNLFFLYIFGKLVEEEEGNFALWLSYFFTGAGANLVSWLILPRNAVSMGASGAVFGLFAISVLVKMSWDWRKILEVLILGQFVIERELILPEAVSRRRETESNITWCLEVQVMDAAQASASLGGGRGLQNVNHIAHLSGALIGVVLIWLVSRVPSPTDEK